MLSVCNVVIGTQLSTLQKRLNWLRCHLWCGLGWVGESSVRWGAHGRHLANMIEWAMLGGSVDCCSNFNIVVTAALGTIVMVFVPVSRWRRVVRVRRLKLYARRCTPRLLRWSRRTSRVLIISSNSSDSCRCCRRTSYASADSLPFRTSSPDTFPRFGIE